MEHLFKTETISQRKIMEWLVQQGLTGKDVASVNLTGPALVRITNPAGQYMDLYYDKQSGVRVLDITAEREEDMHWYWNNETNEYETQEWREDLSADEAAMVDQWDARYSIAYATMAKRIIDLENAQKQSNPPRGPEL